MVSFDEINGGTSALLTVSGFSGIGRSALIQEIQKPIVALPFGEITQLITDTIRCSPADAQALAELILDKKSGNPFFVNEFLKTLYHDKLITFDPSANRWVWDVDQIKQQDITDNVVELIWRGNIST